MSVRSSAAGAITPAATRSLHCLHRYLAHVNVEKFKGFCCTRCFERNVGGAAQTRIHCLSHSNSILFLTCTRLRLAAMERSGMASCAAMSWPRPVCPSKLHIAEIHRGSSLGAVLEPTGPQSKANKVSPPVAHQQGQAYSSLGVN